MATDDAQQPVSERISRSDRVQPARIRDIPALIKYFLLFLLIALFVAEWAGGEYSRARGWDFITWIILLLKLILILGLIVLIHVQRRLRCQITAPSGCATPVYDAALDKWVVVVTGTAGGAAFGGYTLSVQRPPGTPYPVPVLYPGGGSSGGSPVNGGELGRLDVTHIEPAPMRVVLTVNPAGSGSPQVCTSDFDIMNRIVWIESIGGVPARIMGTHPDDGSEVLKLVKLAADPSAPAPPGPETSVGGGISVGGGADISGCGRQMVEYALQFREVAASMSSPWQMDAPGMWDPIHSPLPYGPPGDPAHPRTFHWLFGVFENIVRHGALTRVWGLGDFLMSLFPPTYAQGAYTSPAGWNTTALNGRYTVRLVVKHQPVIGPPSPTPPELYDSATVWIDNRTIEGRITHLGIEGGGSLGVCEELSLSQFVGPGPAKINATINGRAWDPIITDDYPPGDAPNDNFDRYKLTLQKNGSAPVDIATSTVRVPNVLQETPLPVLPAGTGVLHLWDIVAALDAGPPPTPLVPAPDPKIYRGDRCAYIIHLHVQDETRLSDTGHVHEAQHDFPFCIENDIPANAPFPMP